MGVPGFTFRDSVTLGSLPRGEEDVTASGQSPVCDL